MVTVVAKEHRNYVHARASFPFKPHIALWRPLGILFVAARPAYEGGGGTANKRHIVYDINSHITIIKSSPLAAVCVLVRLYVFGIITAQMCAE